MPLTAEQLARMEQSKAAALARKTQRAPGEAAARPAVSAGTGPRPCPTLASSGSGTVLSEEQRRLVDEKRRLALTRLSSTQQTPAAANHPAPTSSSSIRLQPPTARQSPGKQSSRNHNPNQKGTSAKNFYSNGGKVVKGECVLVATGPQPRFEISAPYHKQLIESLKSVDSAVYNAKKKVWSFPVVDHDKVLQLTNTLRPEVEVAPLPHWILTTFKQPRGETSDGVDISGVEPHLLNSLMPFQRSGVQYGVSRAGRVLIADDMGLGKTVQALALASYYRSAWPVLIVCPSTLKYNWQAAVFRWLPSSVSEQEISVISSGRDYIGSDLFTVISYDLVTKKQEELLSKKFQFIILDESHCIKDSKSGRTRAVEPLLRAARHLVFLSGTPALSRPIELFSQLQALQPRLFRWVSEFGNRYCAGYMKRFGAREVPCYQGSSHMEELALLLRERCMVRRLKAEVLTQLPSKQRCTVTLDPAGVDTKSKVMKENKKINEKDELKGHERKAFILEWFNDTASAKLKAVKDYLKDLISTKDTKFLVFAHHKVMLHGIREVLEDCKVDYIYIDGGVPSDKRKERVDQFQTQDAVRAAVLSITAANNGITLTAAQLVVMAELFWNPGILSQAEDRAHRIGQTDSVVVHYLVAKETADDVIWPLLSDKLKTLNQAGLSKDDFEEAEFKPFVDPRQSTIDDCFGLQEEKEDLELLRACMTDEDFDLTAEPSKKKCKS